MLVAMLYDVRVNFRAPISCRLPEINMGRELERAEYPNYEAHPTNSEMPQKPEINYCFASLK